MSNNIQRAVAIGADFKLVANLSANAFYYIEELLGEPTVPIPPAERHKIGEALEIIGRIHHEHSIHRAIEYAESELIKPSK